MWIIQWKNIMVTGKNPRDCGNYDLNGKMLKIILCKLKNPHSKWKVFPNWNVDNVDNYMPRRCSPTCTMSPAPIVINKSPFIHFFNKNFSISSKDAK